MGKNLEKNNDSVNLGDIIISTSETLKSSENTCSAIEKKVLDHKNDKNKS